MGLDLRDQLRSLERPSVDRLSISLPEDLGRWVRETATDAGVPISRVIELALRQMEDAEPRKSVA